MADLRPGFLSTSRDATHRGSHLGPSLPGAGTQSLEALSLCLDTGAWRAVPSPLPAVQREAFPVGDTAPLHPARPPAESPDLHSAKAVRTEQEHKHKPSVWGQKAAISSALLPGMRANLTQTIEQRREVTHADPQVRGWAHAESHLRKPTFLLSWLEVNFSTLTPFTSSSRAPGGTPALSAAPPGVITSQKGPRNPKGRKSKSQCAPA